MKELTSRERLEIAYDCGEPDRVPIVLRPLLPMEHHWGNAIERAEYLLGLGADDVLTVPPPFRPHPDVTSRVWREDGEPYPILHKEWRTPAGDLHASVYLTPDWQVKDIALYSDHAWSRGIDYLVKSEADLDALDYILHDPRDGDLSAFREKFQHLRNEADRLGVVLQGNVRAAPLYAMGFMGGKRCITAVRDEPDLFAELLRRVHRWSKQSMSLLLEMGVDVIFRSGCYETVDFFAPRDVREFFMPILKEDVELCHQAGVKFHFFAQTGIAPFLEEYADIGVDILSSLDTGGVNGVDLADVKRRIGDRVCLMGGVDNREPFLNQSPSEMERTVLEVLRVMAPGGGYILSTTGMIFPEGKEENILAFIRAGRKYGRYPLNLPP